MKEFEYSYQHIFSGLTAKEINKKSQAELLECHNIEPTGEDYKLHESIIDLNATGQDWNNTASDSIDYWEDHSDDTFDIDDSDEFTDI